MKLRNEKVGKVETVAIDPMQFELHADPIFWKGKAEQLKRSALVLAQVFFDDCDRLRRHVVEYEETGHSSIPVVHGSNLDQFTLLAAFSIENLLKAFVIFKKPGLLTDGKLHGILKSHDLVALANRAEFPLSQDELQFCMIGSSAAVSWGRYPIAKTSKSVVVRSVVGGGSVEVFCALFDRLNGEFDERFSLRVRVPLESRS